MLLFMVLALVDFVVLVFLALVFVVALIVQMVEIELVLVVSDRIDLRFCSTESIRSRILP